MKVAICGCSFSSVTRTYHSDYKILQNTHFSELLQKDHDVVNFAQPGVSNYHIRLQVDEAIKCQPDVVILTPTTVPRFEIVQKSLTNDQNIFDQIYFEISNSSKMISTTFLSALKNEYLSKYQKRLVNEFVRYFYDPLWDTKKQIWVLGDALAQLKHNQIPCLLQPWFLNDFKFFDEKDFEKNFEHIYGYIIPYKDSICSYKIDFKKKAKDPGYHTTVESQEKFYLYLVENAFDKVNTL